MAKSCQTVFTLLKLSINLALNYFFKTFMFHANFQNKPNQLFLNDLFFIKKRLSTFQVIKYTIC
ncbi:hypothetical protein CPS_3773 [Colwellia psychrerythraea 34H]|uniref:Uncharacterized protein n=1 Tax=Colwellia psychrerythraea (strain 34H / ATCC BAA-681) TaxID=167879 RepID=Q47XN0_COLP3|nr:hypothetical protein CPS_3773 [Colwellia psychrerythraea 34H]